MLQSFALIGYLLPLPFAAHVVAMVLMAAALITTVVTGLDYLRSALALRRGAQPAR